LKNEITIELGRLKHHAEDDGLALTHFVFGSRNLRDPRDRSLYQAFSQLLACSNHLIRFQTTEQLPMLYEACLRGI